MPPEMDWPNQDEQQTRTHTHEGARAGADANAGAGAGAHVDAHRHKDEQDTRESTRATGHPPHTHTLAQYMDMSRRMRRPEH